MRSLTTSTFHIQIKDVIEAEMSSIKKNSKTLQEFYDEINQALNMGLTKITMIYKEAGEQKSLIAETQNKADSLIRTTLYGNMPSSLSRAFAIAQTIQFDNQHLQLESKMHEHKGMKKFAWKNFKFKFIQIFVTSQHNQTKRRRLTPVQHHNNKNQHPWKLTDRGNSFKKLNPNRRILAKWRDSVNNRGVNNNIINRDRFSMCNNV